MCIFIGVYIHSASFNIFRGRSAQYYKLANNIVHSACWLKQISSLVYAISYYSKHQVINISERETKMIELQFELRKKSDIKGVTYHFISKYFDFLLIASVIF